MASVHAELAALLTGIRRPGDFFASGEMEIFPPRIEVEGVGVVALPLLPLQAQQLIAVAERAPYGKGEETITDTAVRRTWQIAPDRIRIEGRHWAATLATILERVAETFGVTDPIEAAPYKMLLYDAGSFFVSHRDTEKEPGMFATLVIVLPSLSTGGTLVARHKGREVRFDPRCDHPSQIAYAAFYADCVHEVLPVTSGCRMVMVYNLRRKGRGPVPLPPDYDNEQTRVAACLRLWAEATREEGTTARDATGEKPPGEWDDEEDEEDDDDDDDDDDDGEDHGPPEKLIYLLEHAYTPAELGFATLKGADAGVAEVMTGAAPKAGCELHLALLSVEESGSAEYTGDYRRRGRRRSRSRDEGEENADDSAGFEVIEVDSHEVTLTEWHRPDGAPAAFVSLPARENELVPEGVLEELEPDEEHFQEATGNEGASFERTYRRAALVVWPQARVMAVINQGGLAATLPYLADLGGRWAARGEADGSTLWDQAHALSGHMLARWPRQPNDWRERDTVSDVTRMLEALAHLRDAKRIDAFVSLLATREGHEAGENAALLEALDVLKPTRAGTLLDHLVSGHAAATFGACADLLARAAGGREAKIALKTAAQRLVAALPDDPAVARQTAWRGGGRLDAGGITAMLLALDGIDPDLARQAVTRMLAWPSGQGSSGQGPSSQGMDMLLVPALRAMIEADAPRGSAAMIRLRGACLDYLRARGAMPLEAPRDWRRDGTIGCSCDKCAALSAFLIDPTQEIWRFRAAAPDRGHVESTIRNAHCDVNVSTERRGSPHTLVCTKNQASHARLVARRNKDRKDLAFLERDRPGRNADRA